MSTSPNAVPPPTLQAIFQMCPPLPNISPALLDQVYTHRSFAARPNNIFQDNPNDPTPDNESLEHLGDSVLNLITTLQIETLYPHLHVGPASKIRALIVANTHLAYFTQHYKLHYNLRGNISQQLTLQASLPIHADLFEAYVGALFKEQGLEPVRDWLSSVLTPSIRLAYEVVRYGYDSTPPSELAFSVFPPDPSDTPLLSPPIAAADDAGFTSLLNQHFAKQHKYLDWEFASPGGTPASPTWTVSASVRGERVLASATATTKKKAKNMASRLALISLGLIQGDNVIVVVEDA